jgi:hypothetical protein
MAPLIKIVLFASVLCFGAATIEDEDPQLLGYLKSRHLRGIHAVTDRTLIESVVTASPSAAPTSAPTGAPTSE